MPSWELFEEQSEDYRNSVLPPAVRARVVIEAGVSLGWYKYAGDKGRMVCRDDFGASAPLKDLREKFGFTPDRVVDKALKAAAAAKV
jgi:transketolase